MTLWPVVSWIFHIHYNCSVHDCSICVDCTCRHNTWLINFCSMHCSQLLMHMVPSQDVPGLKSARKTLLKCQMMRYVLIQICFIFANAMELSAWEAGTCLASQEVPHHSWNIHCHVHRSLLPVLILSQTNAGHIFRLFFFKIHFNVVFPCTLRFYHWWSVSFSLSY